MEKNGGRPKKQTSGLDKKETIGFQKEETNGLDNTETKPKPNKNVNDNENKNVNDNTLALHDTDVEKINDTFIETLGSTNISNIKDCINYLDKLPFEVIEHALKKTAKTGAKWIYTVSILDNYIDKNLNTMDKVIADEIEFKNKNNIKNKKNTNEVVDF